MKKLKAQEVAIATGVFMGLMHALWGLAVSFGFAQTILDFVYNLHFLSNPFVVSQFSLTTALILVVFTSLVGYVMGYVFALIWNKWAKK
ncbi:MAG: hypothetical protein HY044_04570 [Candidatus Woesebacteria bacterium]|nr:MAG: hypothetical protein HY044_04570 [Candidatus Woesebacteria bacterium]